VAGGEEVITLMREVRERAKGLINKVKKNLDLVGAIRTEVFSRQEGMWERISIQKEVLGRNIGAPVYLDTDKKPDVYPILVVNTEPITNVLAWIYLGRRGDKIEAIAIVVRGRRVYAEPRWIPDMRPPG